MDIPVESKPAGHGHADRLPQLAQPDFEAGLQQARNPSEPPDPAPDVSCGDLSDILARMRQASVITTANVLHEADSAERPQRRRGARPENSPT